MKELDWQKAESHIKQAEKVYAEKGMLLGLALVGELVARILQGERSEELYGEIFDIPL
jgi:hypothetical protein